MTAKVCVWPDNNVTGWDGDLSSPAVEFPVVDLLEALTTVYDHDAHFTIGLVHASEQPRLKKYQTNGGGSALKAYRDIGLDPLFSCVAVDVDRPDGHDADAWWAAQVVLLEQSATWATAGWYRTLGGYRLVWTLEEPLRAEAYEHLQRRIYTEMLRVGVQVDVLPDWTRCFRLPFVLRKDGKGQQNHPADFSRLGHLPLAGLQDLPELAKIAHAPLSYGNPWETDLSQEGHGRNKGLLKLAIMTLKGLPDIPDDFLEIFIRGIHDAKCDEPLPDTELSRIIMNARRYRPEPKAVPEADAPDTGANDGFVFGPRRQVLVSKGEMVRALDETLAIMGENKGCLYNMGGGLMRLKRDIEGFLVFEEIPLPALRTVIERMVEYVENGKKGLNSIDAPKDLIAMLAVMADYGSHIWKLQEILTTPSLHPSGEALITKGYHKDLAIYLDCPDNLDNLDLTGDPQKAFDFVKDLLHDVPFEKPEHAAVAMASFIAPVVRTAINGPIPIILFDSTTRGSGKGLLANLTSIIATGRKSVVQPYVSETEFEKRVTALLQMGIRTVMIDNIDRPFGGPTLDALLTADMWTGRVLGETKMIKYRMRAHLMATGNNIQIQGDLDRRALRCYIAPGMENPEKRDPKLYKYPDIYKTVTDNRREYVQAILTFVQAFMKKGCPEPPNIMGLGSFEEWSRIVRGAIMHYGMPDPVESQEALRADSSVAVWNLLLGAMASIWGQGTFSARELFDAAFRQGGGGLGSKAAYTQLETSLEELLGSNQPTARAVSFIMKRWLNRVVDGKKLIKHTIKDRNKGYVFSVVTA